MEPYFNHVIPQPRHGAAPAQLNKARLQTSLSGPLLAAPWASRIREFWPLFNAAGERYRIDPALLYAVALRSGLEPQAVSPQGGHGLMQLRPAVAERIAVALGVERWDLFDAATNVMFGAYRLSCLHRFGMPRLAVAAHYAGPEAVTRASNRVPSDPAVQQYTQYVMTMWEVLRQELRALLKLPADAAAPPPTPQEVLWEPLDGSGTRFGQSRLCRPVAAASAAGRVPYEGVRGLQLLTPLHTPVVATGAGFLLGSVAGNVWLELDVPVVLGRRAYDLVYYDHLSVLRYHVPRGRTGPYVEAGQAIALSGLGHHMPLVHVALIDRDRGMIMAPERLAGLLNLLKLERVFDACLGVEERPQP